MTAVYALTVGKDTTSKKQTENARWETLTARFSMLMEPASNASQGFTLARLQVAFLRFLVVYILMGNANPVFLHSRSAVGSA